MRGSVAIICGGLAGLTVMLALRACSPTPPPEVMGSTIFSAVSPGGQWEVLVIEDNTGGATVDFGYGLQIRDRRTDRHTEMMVWTQAKPSTGDIRWTSANALEVTLRDVKLYSATNFWCFDEPDSGLSCVTLTLHVFPSL